MTWYSTKDKNVRLVRMVRMLAATATATSAALVNMRTPSGVGGRVELKPGDVAPDFSLPGSDGRTYRLSEFRGRQPVVIAWFPKAFTGG